MYYKSIYARVISIGGNSDILNANDIINIKVEETVWYKCANKGKRKKNHRSDDYLSSCALDRAASSSILRRYVLSGRISHLFVEKGEGKGEETERKRD